MAIHPAAALQNLPEASYHFLQWDCPAPQEFPQELAVTALRQDNQLTMSPLRDHPQAWVFAALERLTLHASLRQEVL